jgi:hypothetical protein
VAVLKTQIVCSQKANLCVHAIVGLKVMVWLVPKCRLRIVVISLAMRMLHVTAAVPIGRCAHAMVASVVMVLSAQQWTRVPLQMEIVRKMRNALLLVLESACVLATTDSKGRARLARQ